MIRSHSRRCRRGVVRLASNLVVCSSLDDWENRWHLSNQVARLGMFLSCRGYELNRHEPVGVSSISEKLLLLQGTFCLRDLSELVGSVWICSMTPAQSYTRAVVNPL
jgi:hypothetical protein